MHKGLIFIAAMATALVSGGCSTISDWGDSDAGDSSGWSLVHKPTIQQGTVITEQMLADLQPGMSKEQVRFLLGTPSLIDVFHEDHWDYVFWLKKPDGELTESRLKLSFEDDLLTRIEGDYAPGVEGEAANLEEVVVDVPDNAGDKGIISRSLDAVGLSDE